jgi:HSP20 family protein
MSIIRYDPKSLFDLFNEGIIKGNLTDPFTETHHGGLKVNIVEDDDKFILTAVVPGWSEKDIEVDVKNDQLILKGHAEEEKKHEDKNYRSREYIKTSFERTFRMGSHVDENNIKAKLESGILKVTMPKIKKAEPKTSKIKIES